MLEDIHDKDGDALCRWWTDFHFWWTTMPRTEWQTLNDQVCLDLSDSPQID